MIEKDLDMCAPGPEVFTKTHCGGSHKIDTLLIASPIEQPSPFALSQEIPVEVRKFGHKTDLFDPIKDKNDDHDGRVEDCGPCAGEYPLTGRKRRRKGRLTFVPTRVGPSEITTTFLGCSFRVTALP